MKRHPGVRIGTSGGKVGKGPGADTIKVNIPHTAASGVNLDLYVTEGELLSACDGNANQPYFRVRQAYLNAQRRRYGLGESRLMEITLPDADYLLRDLEEAVGMGSPGGGASDLAPYVPSMRRAIRTLRTILEAKGLL